MPQKRANVKNEKQYEALKDKGMSKERCRQDRELSGRVEPGRKEVRLGRKSIPRRDDRAEEGRRAEGRQGNGAQARLASVGCTTGDRIRTLERGVPSGGPRSLRPYG